MLFSCLWYPLFTVCTHLNSNQSKTSTIQPDLEWNQSIHCQLKRSRRCASNMITVGYQRWRNAHKILTLAIIPSTYLDSNLSKMSVAQSDLEWDQTIHCQLKNSKRATQHWVWNMAMWSHSIYVLQLSKLISLHSPRRTFTSDVIIPISLGMEPIMQFPAKEIMKKSKKHNERQETITTLC